MSNRALTDAVNAAITAGRVRPVIFVEGMFGSSGSPSEEALRFWSGYGDVTWGDRVWSGAGKLLRISPLEESAEVKAVGFNVELSGLPQSTLSLALDNVRQGKSGKVWLGLMGRAGYLDMPGLSLNYASTPDSVANSVTADLDIRVKAAATDWTPATVGRTLFAKFLTTGNQRSWLLNIATTGHLVLSYSPDGETTLGGSSTVAPAFVDGQSYWVRVTLDVDNGAGGRTMRFYTSSDYDPHNETGNWTPLGAALTAAGTTSIFNSTQQLEVGSFQNGGASTPGMWSGKIHYAELRNGIDGAVVARFDPSIDAPGLNATSFTSSTTGEVWTINQFGSGNRARIQMDENVILADPYLVRSGRMDYVSINADGDNTVITAQYEDRLIDLERSRERRYTDVDQQTQYSGDRGFEFVAALQDKQLIWGGAGAASSPLAEPEYESREDPEPVRPHSGSDG